MTDFMQEPLWEEEGKEPPLPKTKETEKTDPVIAAGNAAMAQALPETPVMPKADPVTAKPVKTAEPMLSEPAQDWEIPLTGVFARFTSPDLDTHLAALLDVAHAIPPERVQAVAGAITSALFKLPAEARKPVRDVLVTALKRWPELPLARLVLTRLGGIPAALAPPPTPPADA